MAGLASEPAFRDSVSAVIDAVADIAEAVASVRAINGAPFHHRSLDLLERATAAYLREHRRLLDAVAPRKGRRRVWQPAYRSERNLIVPFVRVAIGVTDVVRLAVVEARPDMGEAWGSHLFSASDIELASFTPLELRGLTTRAAKMLLPEVAADLVDGLAAIAVHGGIADEEQVTVTRASLDDACMRLVREPIGAPLPLALLKEDELARKLRWTVRQLRGQRKRRTIVSVLTWSGEVMYPAFQEFRGEVHPLVRAVAPNVVGSFTGWPLALWLNDQVAQARTPAQAQGELDALSAWQPSYDGPDDDWQPGVPPSPHESVDVSGPLYRVARRGNEPFYFASVQDPASGKRLAPAPSDGGRWDLPIGSGEGTVYLAEEESGAWGETLDRFPIVTLSDILGRTMWTLTPLDPIGVVNLMDPRIPQDLWTELRRTRTQSIALRVRKRGASGMRVPIRSSRSGAAVVLFGRTGPTPPSVVDLGQWRIESSASELDDALWDYLSARPTFRRLGSYLRRFPGEVSLAA